SFTNEGLPDGGSLLVSAAKRHMQPNDIQIIGEELAVKWDDDTESFVRLAKLRKACPCAGCKGETDVMGNLHKGPERPYSLSSFRIRSLEFVGGYAVKPVWEDGHSSGLFAFDYLRAVANSPDNE
ncbi:MAG TPA: DUF971 domain-containing protein, partial [Verrucomicrobiota bacterium]|nr:DUF971 domain-containing protein [Verrucomicrobiota bacterium]